MNNKHLGDVYSGMDLTRDTFMLTTRSTSTHHSRFNQEMSIVIFTPDDTHFDIAVACSKHGMYLTVTKPIVQTLDHRQAFGRSCWRTGYTRSLLWKFTCVSIPFTSVYARDRVRSPTMGNFFKTCSLQVTTKTWPWIVQDVGRKMLAPVTWIRIMSTFPSGLLLVLLVPFKWRQQDQPV